MKSESEVKVAQSCLTLCDPIQARILEWVAFPFSRGSSQPRDWTPVLHYKRILSQLRPFNPENHAQYHRFLYSPFAEGVGRWEPQFYGNGSEHTFLATLGQPLCPASHRTPRVRSAKASLLRGQMLLLLPSSYLFLPEDYSYLFICTLTRSSVRLFFINFLLRETSNTCERTGVASQPHPSTHSTVSWLSCFLCSHTPLTAFVWSRV